jgi:hypothetical protein
MEFSLYKPRKITQNLSQDRRCTCRDVNLEPLEYEPGMLTTPFGHMNKVNYVLSSSSSLFNNDTSTAGYILYRAKRMDALYHETGRTARKLQSGLPDFQLRFEPNTRLIRVRLY